MKNTLILATITAGVCLSAATARAQFQITVAPGTAGATTIVDNGADGKDTDPNPNAIGYNAEIVLGGGAKFILDIHAIQTVTAGSAKVSIDELTISNTGIPMTSSIVVQSSVFAAVGPPFNGRAHLDGRYKAFKGGKIQNASVALSVSALQPAPPILIGTVTIPAAVNLASPVAFGPLATPPNPDVGKQLQIGVTQLGMQLNFTLGVDDRITGPGSAFVEGYTADRALVVNSTADLADGRPGDGVCDTGNATIGFTGVCTLRAALTEADQQQVVTAIQFNIPGSGVPTIQMQPDTTFNFGSMGALQQVIVDGTTQPAGLVEVNGSQASPMDIAGNPIVGLDFVGQKSTVLGMVIYSFPSHAIQIRPSGAPFGGSNVIEEDAIGIDTRGMPLPNGGDGVHISQQPDNSILDNVIANNSGQGVFVDGAPATGNRIHANSIVANGGLGISLTNNANNSQSAPVLTIATEDDSDLTIGGTLHSAPNLTFSLDIFVNNKCDPSGSGEGETYLGSTTAATDAIGDASFTAILPANFVEGLVATATATDPAGNTSAFSACAAVKQVPPTTQPPVANAGSDQAVSAGTLVMLNGTGSHDPNTPPLPLTYKWTQSAGPAISLTGSNTATPSFTPAQTGAYIFSLVVNNGVVNSTVSSVTITVSAQLPVANAGPNQAVSTGTVVKLNGKGSFDPNIPPLPLTYHWTQTAGPAVTLAGANTATPKFTAAQAGTYIFSLVVNDRVTSSAAASVTITVVTPQSQLLIEDLIVQVHSLGLPKFLDNRLISRLKAAETALNQRNTRRAIHQLQIFIDEVKRQSGKRIPVEQADKLIAAAQGIIEGIKTAS